MESPRKLELHYYFSDDSHSMNAHVRNKCETEFLAAAIEVASILELNVELDCEALKEGGIREIWNVLGENSAQIAILISALALFWSNPPKNDLELIDLQKEDLRLSIEQRNQALNEIKNDVKNNKITPNTIESAKSIASTNHKVTIRKSNFYKTISTYEKVTKIGFNKLNSKGERITEEKIITRKDFKNFIITSKHIKPLKDNSAHIEIIAPVLNDGQAKWKGIYEGQIISFSMDDNHFKEAVVSKRLSFKNGDGINCILIIHKRLDEHGEVVTSGYSVEVVLDNINSGISGETLQGRSYRHTKNMIESQEDMFEENNA